MEQKMNEVKGDLLKGELKDFSFTEEMKQSVLNHVGSRQARKTPINIWTRRVIPTVATLTFFGLFATGIYQATKETPAGDPTIDQPPPIEEAPPPVDPVEEEKVDDYLPPIEEENKPDDNQEVIEEKEEEIDKQQEVTIPNTEDQKEKILKEAEEAVIGIFEEYEERLDWIFEHEMDENSVHFRFNEQYKVRNDFYSHFNDLFTLEIIESAFYLRLSEEEDGLYFLPTHSPISFSSELEYKTSFISSTKVELTQNHEFDDLRRPHILTINIEKINNSWIITYIDPIFS